MLVVSVYGVKQRIISISTKLEITENNGFMDYLPKMHIRFCMPVRAFFLQSTIHPHKTLTRGIPSNMYKYLSSRETYARTICLFVLYIDKPVLQAAATEGELPTDGVWLGDLAQPVHESALARANITCSVVHKKKVVINYQQNMSRDVRGHNVQRSFPQGENFNWLSVQNRYLMKSLGDTTANQLFIIFCHHLMLCQNS